MKVGDLVTWRCPTDTGIVGLIEFVDREYIYVRWADGNLDDYCIHDEVMLRCLEVINEGR